MTMNKMLMFMCFVGCNAAPTTGASTPPAPSVIYVQVPTPAAPAAPPATVPPLQYAERAPQGATEPQGQMMPHGNWGLEVAQPEPSRTLHKIDKKPCGLTSCALEDQCCAEGTLHVHGCYPQAYVCQRHVR